MNAQELSDKIWNQVQKQMQFRGIVTPEAGVNFREWLQSLLDSALGEAHSEGRIEGESAGWRRGSADGFKEAIKTCEERANKWRHENVEEAKTDYRRKVTWDKSHEADDCAEALRAKAKEVG